jgi:hypothetical protein
MYHILLYRVKEGWREAHLKLAHSHSHIFTYLLMTKFDKAGKTGLSHLPNWSIRFW